MKKAFRDIKRGVNKKVLKVPSIEQKVLDATSNESWGPHGTHLADIAQASRNYHEHQIIMSVIWKRLNDTGKNWRHVFKFPYPVLIKISMGLMGSLMKTKDLDVGDNWLDCLSLEDLYRYLEAMPPKHPNQQHFSNII